MSSLGFGMWAELSNSSGWRKLALQQQQQLLAQHALQEALEQQQQQQVLEEDYDVLAAAGVPQLVAHQGVSGVHLLQGEAMVGRHPITSIPHMTSAAAIAASNGTTQGAAAAGGSSASSPPRSSFPQYEHLVRNATLFHAFQARLHGVCRALWLNLKLE
jgi:hypothetical protein